MQQMAGELAHHLGKRASDEPLSNYMLFCFLKRWDSRISTLKPSALDSNRAKHSTQEIVSKYFENLKWLSRSSDVRRDLIAYTIWTKLASRLNIDHQTLSLQSKRKRRRSRRHDQQQQH
ncbi:hypothetical protein DPMN_019315 [Dreissena polymorpha]|uniref:Uncharacterized protein n=1 Tax=Dreissena polymorpha TaxID=45954 RepID=A0A9D4S964_DREPO|nr:hypothetical protein DPMN_019315 [Dreissena polymorpha]